MIRALIFCGALIGELPKLMSSIFTRLSILLISRALLRRLPSAKPVVITLHDLSPITGGCDYPGSCRRFEAACGCCPIINSYRSNDYSHRIFRMKKTAYSRSSQGRLAFVANSVWSGEQARQSSLAKDRTVQVIHYGLDQDVYSPRKRREAREALGIGAEESGTVVCRTRS